MQRSDSHHAHLSTKLQKNYRALEKCGLVEKGNWKIKKILPLGDKHFNGEAVSLVTMINNGKCRKILYKPHSLKIDKAFSHFMQWINKKTSMNYKTVNCWSSLSYGWAEYISFKECRSRAEVMSYYRRLGGLLAICHFLFGIDIHHDNIIAHGEYPVIVDHETFFTPMIENDLCHRNKHNLVIFTAILPRWRSSSMSKAWVDKSAFSGFWRVRKLKKDHIPKINGGRINPYHYQNEFIEGFKEVFSVFQDNRDELLAKVSPLGVFKSTLTRVVLRDTSYYYQCLKKIAANPLNPVLTCELSKFEIAALQKKDIPYFVTKTTGKALFDAYGNKTAERVSTHGYRRVLEHICRFTHKENLSLQIQLIKQCFAAGTKNYGLPINIKRNNHQCDLKDIKNYVSNRVQILEDTCIRSKSEIYWTTIVQSTSNHWLPNKTSLDFKQGTLGIILALSYANKYFKSSVSTAIITAGLRDFHSTLRKSPKAVVASLQMIGEALYALYYLKKNLDISFIPQVIQKLLHIADQRIRTYKNANTATHVTFYLLALLTAKDAIPECYWKKHANFCINVLLKMIADPLGKSPFCLQLFMRTFWAFTRYCQLHSEPILMKWLHKAAIFIKANLARLLNQFSFLIFLLNFSLQPLSQKILGDVSFPAMDKWLTKKLISKVLSQVKFFEGVELWVALTKVAWFPITQKQELLSTWFKKSYSNNDICPGLIDGNAGFVYQLLRLLKPIEMPSVLLFT